MTSNAPSVAPPVDLGDRRTYIGASEAAAVLGLSKRTTPLQVYLSKVDPSFKAFTGNNYSRRGVALEPHIALAYERRHNVDLEVPAECVHPQHEFIRAHLDRIVRGKPEVFVEIKTDYSPSPERRKQWGDPGSDAVPDDYMVQVATQFACYPPGQLCHVAVDLGEEADVEYALPRNERLIGNIVPKLVEFWQRNVLQKLPPDPVTELDCKLRWSVQSGKVYEATEADLVLLGEIRDNRELKNRFEKRDKELVVELRKRVRDADTIMVDGNVYATFKEVTRRAEEKPRPAVTYRDLRIKGGE